MDHTWKKLVVRLAVVGLLVIGIIFLIAQPFPSPVDRNTAVDKTVVVSAPDDPLYPLAQEIARQDKINLVSMLPEAFQPGTGHVIWVVSPARLSDAGMVAAGRLQMQSGLQTALGIITGSDLDEARRLWERQKQVFSRHAFAVNGEYPTAGVERGRILNALVVPPRSEPLTRENLTQTLRAADYLTFTGHGGGRSWSLEEGTALRSADVPGLPPVVVSAASCQTFRPWVDSSIALTFTRQGAAAYAGFVFSPLEGYLLGEFDGLPFRFTSPEFTIGQVMLVQNHGTLHGFASYPHYFLLGDPRSALNSAPVFQPETTDAGKDERILRFSNLPPGVIPIRVEDGARFVYLETAGTAISDWDLFFNDRVQMLAIGQDRYILVDQPGGDVELRLREQPPLTWRMVDPLLDGLDYTLIFLNHRDDVLLSLGAGAMALLGAGFAARRRGLTRRSAAVSAVGGLVMLALHAGYALARSGQVTINAKPDLYFPLAPLGTFLLATSGLLLYHSSRSRWLRLGGWLAVLFPMLGPVALTGGMVLFLNVLALRTFGASIYNFHILLGPVIAGGVHAVFFYLLLAGTRSFIDINRKI